MTMVSIHAVLIATMAMVTIQMVFDSTPGARHNERCRIRNRGGTMT